MTAHQCGARKTPELHLGCIFCPGRCVSRRTLLTFSCPATSGLGTSIPAFRKSLPTHILYLGNPHIGDPEVQC
jgi:hypothetical protein